MKQEKEAFYKMLKENGELDIFFEDMTGDWSRDKKKFCDNYDKVIGSLETDTTDDFSGIEE